MATRVTLVPGDGIGPEVIGAARRAIDATGVPIEWDPREIGAGAFVRTGDPLPSATLDSIRANRVALKGPVDTPSASGMRSVNLALRRSLFAVVGVGLTALVIAVGALAAVPIPGITLLPFCIAEFARKQRQNA